MSKQVAPPSDTPESVSKTSALLAIAQLAESLKAFPDREYLKNSLSVAFDIPLLESAGKMTLKESSVPSKTPKELYEEYMTDALKKKAQKAKLSTSEVKLTSAEDKALRRKARFSNEKTAPSKKPASPIGKTSKGSILVSALAESRKSDDGSRATHKRRLMSIRNRLRSFDPSNQEKPVLLHLIRYMNTYATLEFQWLDFQRNHEVDVNNSPFKGLRKVDYHEGLEEGINHLVDTGVLEILPIDGSRGVEYYKLENSGGSFFLGDEPTSVCPSELKVSFNWPEPVEGELEDLVLLDDLVAKV